MFAGENDKPGVEERYSTAVSSSNLAVNPRSRMSDTDVLGAMGHADRELTKGRTSAGDPVVPAPLAVALERLLSGGDSRTAHHIVRELSGMVWRHARGEKIKLTHADATEMSKAVLAWYRHGVCRPCGGHGYTLIPGTKTHSDSACSSCKGSGKLPLEKQFKAPVRPLVRWLAGEIEREAGRAGPRAMAHLAGQMQL